jgi:hypothetical protein
MNPYDKLMFDFYQVLNNAWRQKTVEASKSAIRLLIATKETTAITPAIIDELMQQIEQQLGGEFAGLVREQQKTFIERSYRYGLNDAQREVPTRFGIGLYGVTESSHATIFAKQQHFWIGEHFSADISKKFSNTLFEAIDRGFTTAQLADHLQSQFADVAKKGRAYWQGLAEHTALRVREFGRLRGYEKAGARGYKLINPMDAKTSDICRALIKQDKVYPLAQALEVRDKLLAVEMQEGGLERARDYIKALAPWVSDKDVLYDADGEPTGVQGAHTPFPPFHWKCRTETAIVM